MKEEGATGTETELLQRLFVGYIVRNEAGDLCILLLVDANVCSRPQHVSTIPIKITSRKGKTG
jgi:hypothetical protein